MFVIIGWVLALACIFGVYVAHGGNMGVIIHALPFEFMLNALRLRDGVPLASFSERTGLPLSAIAAPLAEAERLGLVEPGLQQLVPTARGYDFLNDLVELFLPG